MRSYQPIECHTLPLSYLISLHSQARSRATVSLCSKRRQVAPHSTNPPHYPTLQTWRLKVPRTRTCEHPRWLDSAASTLADQKSKPVSRPCAAPPQLRPYPILRLTYRNHTARRSKSAVYAKVVYRKCGERVTEERLSHLDTSTTPVRPLFPPYVYSMVV